MKISNDKLLHFIIGTYIALISSIWLHWYFAMAIVVTLAIGKEIYDKVVKKKTPEMWDFLATLIGGIMTIVLIELIR